MGKDLEFHNDNVREVLFEKTELYHYETLDGFNEGMCLETCMLYEEDIMIGSASCSDCVYNKGYNCERMYIICSRLTKALGNG